MSDIWVAVDRDWLYLLIDAINDIGDAVDGLPEPTDECIASLSQLGQVLAQTNGAIIS